MLHTLRTFYIEYPLKEAQTCIAGIPWSSAEIGKSVKYGPLFIRQALREIEGFDPGTKKDVFERKFCDLGDIDPVPSNWELTRQRIVDTIDYVFKVNPNVFPIFFGGDHLITLGILEGMKKRHGPFTVIHFDAHRDISSDWEGEKYSHITWGYYAIKTLGLKLVQLGIRSSTAEEDKTLPSLGIKETLDNIQGKVYITFDLDIFDPGFSPQVGTPEPLGMAPMEVFSLLKKACSFDLIGMDIVECASDQVNTQTALLGAQVFKMVELWKK